MSCNPVIRTYCQQVGKAMELPRTHKRHLLDGLERELEERFFSEPGVTLEILCRDAGSPEESASALMACVDKKELIQYRSRWKLLTRIAIIALVALTITVISYYFYAAQYEIDHTDVRIIQNNIG